MTAIILTAAIVLAAAGFGVYADELARRRARERDERTAEREAAARQDDHSQELAAVRAELEKLTGTLIPPGWNAIVQGEQAEPGHWVPPGFTVVMAPGPVNDDRGNSLGGGTDNILWGGEGNTFFGQSHTRRGVKPY